MVGSEKNLISAYADVPVRERPSWRAYATQEPYHIADWDIGPLVFVPLTTPHRRLGAQGMSGSPAPLTAAKTLACYV